VSWISCRIANAVPDGSPLNRLFDGHRQQCLNCQADAVRSRGVARDLGGLEGEVLPAPGGLHTQVMATLPRQDASNPRRQLMIRVVARWATAIGVGVAALAAIVGYRFRRRT
jgi:hypothetical protein